MIGNQQEQEEEEEEYYDEEEDEDGDTFHEVPSEMLQIPRG